MFRRGKPAAPKIESNIDPDPVTHTERTRITVHYTEAQWQRVLTGARRRGIDPEAFIIESSSEEPASIKMVRADWLKPQLQALAEMLPQVGPVREKIEQFILSLG